MACPNHEFAYADGTPQLELLGAATSGNLALLERMARQLDGGRGRLAEAVEAVNDHGAGALHLAAAGNRAEVCEFLVEDVRVNVDALDNGGRTPPVYAITCQGGHVDIVRYLLDQGANRDNVDIKGLTPLHEAAKIGHCEIVELLLSRGAYVDPFSTYDGTPLHVAMKILLDHHADCNKILENFCSPLMIAINRHSMKCVNLLLEAGADVKGIRGSTPLVLAAVTGLTDVLKPLLDAGAGPNVRNEYGHLPVQIAAYYGTRKDVEILFEVTSRIPAIHDWSVDGIINHAKQQPKLEDFPLSKMSRAELKEEGHKALHKGDYSAALEFYDMVRSTYAKGEICQGAWTLKIMAESVDGALVSSSTDKPAGLHSGVAFERVITGAMVVDRENIDSNLYGNRGFCRLLLGNGEGALNDAHLCRAMQRDCADSCWLQGYSHVLLKEYDKACDAFLDGLKLRPCFVGIEKGLG